MHTCCAVCPSRDPMASTSQSARVDTTDIECPACCAIIAVRTPSTQTQLLLSRGTIADHVQCGCGQRVALFFIIERRYSDDAPDPKLCPTRVQSSLEAYVRGLPPGDFVRAVLSSDLNDAIARADDVNIHALPHVVAYVREHLPAVAWGSPAAVNRWLASNNYEQRAKAARLRERVSEEAPSGAATEREG